MSQESSKIIIKEVIPKRYREMVGSDEFMNLEVDPAFGQKWNLPNFSTKQTYDFGNKFYGKILKDESGMLEEGEKFYLTLVRLNPELGNIKKENTERMLDIIRGVGSGLHYNDIKYFVEDLKGSGANESEENYKLWEQAVVTYFNRNGIKLNSLPEDLPEEEYEALQKSERYHDISNKISFAFSPETCRRIIENKPYN